MCAECDDNIVVVVVWWCWCVCLSVSKGLVNQMALGWGCMYVSIWCCVCVCLIMGRGDDVFVMEGGRERNGHEGKDT